MTDALKDWRVLLVGGSGGIGTAVAEAMLAEGVAELIVAPPAAHLRGGRVSAEQVDLINRQSVEAMAARLSARPLHAVVNCAGVNGNRRLFDGDWAGRARREMDVNYFGMLNLAAAFGPLLAAQPGGRFMTLLSFLSHATVPGMTSYCASKAAAHSALKGLRAEWATVGVQVCGVYPTAVDTAMSRDVQGQKQSPRDLAREILRALVDGQEELYPGDAADAFKAFLADPLGMQRAMLN
ncbi:MAG: SDR family NAD(P)-dependent oxidoreductase [Variovorax sp.]